jgi:hypothetical protein
MSDKLPGTESHSIEEVLPDGELADLTDAAKVQTVIVPDDYYVLGDRVTDARFLYRRHGEDVALVGIILDPAAAADIVEILEKKTQS